MAYVLQMMLLLTIVSSILAMFVIPKAQRGVFSVLMLLSVAALGVESFGFYSAKYHVPNIVVYNGYIILELVLIHLVLFKLDSGLKWLFVVSLFLGILSLVVQLYSGMNLHEDILLWTSLFVGLAVVAFALVILVKHTLNVETLLQRTPTFWILMGLLIYFGGYIPVLSGESYLAIVDEAIFDNVYRIMNILAILRYLFFTLAAYFRLQSVRVETLKL